ncbi:MAG: hypothetical protein IT310_05155 [Anaerolineales bacterium]|nr:hypothetical protein [Anaerolineales bacterium]
MKELLEYRVFLVRRLERAADEFCSACLNLEPTQKITADKTAHQLVFYARGLNELVYDFRARKTLSEENPLFENFDPPEWLAQHYDPTEAYAKILDEFKTQVHALCVTLAQIPSADWSRVSSHQLLGNDLTLQLWVEYGLAQIEERLVEIRRGV